MSGNDSFITHDDDAVIVDPQDFDKNCAYLLALIQSLQSTVTSHAATISDHEARITALAP